MPLREIMKTGTSDGFDPQSILPKRVRNRWEVVHRSSKAVDYGYAALFVGFISAIFGPADWNPVVRIGTLLALCFMAVLFAFMGDRQRRKDAVELEKAIRVGAELDEMAKIWEEDSNSPDTPASIPVDDQSA